MTDQSPFPLSNSYCYRLLSGTSHCFVLLFILGHLMSIILRKHRFTNICNLFAICVITFHVPHPYKSSGLVRILNIRILVFISLFLFSHNVCSSTKIPFALLICALTYWSAPPSAVTALPTHLNCSTLSVTTLFILPFVLIFEFILSSFVLFDCSRKVKPKFQLHMEFSTGVLISP